MSRSAALFPGFERLRMPVAEATINGVIGGNGPPLLLLHGWPQSHLQWHKVAALLKHRFTVIATDLRGYGDSSKPDDGINHAGYSKRATAADQVEVMRELGYERFAVIGHDRGARVAHRMALDFPDVVSRVAMLDIIPTLKVFESINQQTATAYFHWFFLIQPAPLPETLLLSNPEFFLTERTFKNLVGTVIHPEAYADYLRCFRDPATQHAMCEDYRAGASIDLEHDRADLARKVECPLLALWGERGPVHGRFDVLECWRERATYVSGHVMAATHWLTEEVPDQIALEITEFCRD